MHLLLLLLSLPEVLLVLLLLKGFSRSKGELCCCTRYCNLQDSSRQDTRLRWRLQELQWDFAAANAADNLNQDLSSRL
jgi:hypothetical protein